MKRGPHVTIQADGDQLDQLLINLVRNAVDASLETGGKVTVGWHRDNGQVAVWVRDEGPGLPDTSNLFVPFFTTKPNGSGIGLALSRQITDAHRGTLTLADRKKCARLRGAPASAALVARRIRATSSSGPTLSCPPQLRGIPAHPSRSRTR